jgi:hypothetical protein
MCAREGEAVRSEAPKQLGQESCTKPSYSVRVAYDVVSGVAATGNMSHSDDESSFTQGLKYNMFLICEVYTVRVLRSHEVA